MSQTKKGSPEDRLGWDPDFERRRRDAGRRRRARQAFALWGELVLESIVLLTALIAWHLVRRGRLLRERLSNPPAEPGLHSPDAPPSP